MPPLDTQPRLTAVVPAAVCPGGRVHIDGHRLLPADGRLPEVHLGGHRLRVAAASSTRIQVEVAQGIPGGLLDLGVAGVPGTLPLHVARTLATDVHQVDSPVIDRAGRVYATFSGSRGDQASVSIFRLSAGGLREPFSSAVSNPTSMAIGPDGALYVSSRFEGTVSRVGEDGTAALVASNLGVACGLAFDTAGALFVGDRSGTVLRVSIETGEAIAVATLPPSIAAFHLAFGPDGWLYVTAPTLSPADSVYRIEPVTGRIETVSRAFGRPQGLAFDRSGALHVADALAGASGVYRLEPGDVPRLVVGGDRLVGLAFDAGDGMVVAASDTIYRLESAEGIAGRHAG